MESCCHADQQQQISQGSAKPPTPFSAGLLQAVLLEQDLLSLKDLSAVIVCDGRRGDNLIRQYDHGMAITLQVGTLLFAVCCLLLNSACCLLGLKDWQGNCLLHTTYAVWHQRHCSQPKPCCEADS